MNQWFVLHIDRVGVAHRQGPMPAESLALALRAGRVLWSDLAFCPGESSGWARIFDIKRFRDSAPAAPPIEVLKACREQASSGQGWGLGAVESLHALPEAAGRIAVPRVPPAPPRADLGSERVWYLQVAGEERGPLTRGELVQLLEARDDGAPTHAWREGMRNWRLVRTTEELDEITRTTRIATSMDTLEIETGRNVRAFARQSLVATVYRRVDEGEHSLIGTCADVSERGLQLEVSPGVELRPEQQLMLEVFPLSRTGVPSFVVAGTVVWRCEATRRAGFRFGSIHETARRAVARYVQGFRREDEFLKKIITEDAGSAHRRRRR